MRAIDYALRQAWASLVRGGTSSIFAVVAITLAITVLGVLLLLTWNLERVLAQWTEAAEFSVYLRDDASSEQRGAVEAAIDESGVALGREFVSKDQALVRFRREFAGLASLADGLGENPFPASIEVRVRPAAETDGSAAVLVTDLAALPGVADVRHDREWLARVGTGLNTLRAAALALALLMGGAAALTVATVVRLGLHARREEIEIMDLVGAPLLYIRGPFVAEGLLQGGAGALIALVLLKFGHLLAQAWWGAGVGAMVEGGAISFLPAPLWSGLLAGGMLVGSLGGFAAARHAG